MIADYFTHIVISLSENIAGRNLTSIGHNRHSLPVNVESGNNHGNTNGRVKNTGPVTEYRRIKLRA